MEEHGNTIVGKFEYKLENPVEVGEISLVLGNFDCSGKEAQNFPSQKFSKTKFFQLEIFPTSNVPILYFSTYQLQFSTRSFQKSLFCYIEFFLKNFGNFFWNFEMGFNPI